MLQTTKHMLTFVVLKFSKQLGPLLKIGSAVSDENFLVKKTQCLCVIVYFVSMLCYVVGSVYNPEYYARLSEIFKRYHSKVEQNAQVSVKSEDGSDYGSEDAPRVSGTYKGDQLPPFTPRQISLQHMLSDPKAPWRNYRPLRGPQSFQGLRHNHLAGIDLSHSLSFLINAGAQLIDTRPEELYEQILRVESSFVNTVQKELKKLDGFMASCRQ